jgi:hypothetical protein
LFIYLQVLIAASSASKEKTQVKAEFES